METPLPSELYGLRPATADDGEFLTECFAVERAELFASMPEPMRSTLLAQQRAAFERDLMSRAELRDRIVTLGGRPVGRLVESREAEGWWIVDLRIVEAGRGRGIGTRLVADLVDEARRAGVSIGFHVRHGHPATPTWARLGFVVTGSDEFDLEMRADPSPER